jgi:hypothetical protein
MANQTGTDGDAIENAVLASANLEPEKRASAPGALLEGVDTLHDSVFDKLVHQEEDVIGLLAYSLSMQNKRDWLTAFKQELGRDPNAAELAAYDIGERIERRLGFGHADAGQRIAGRARCRTLQACGVCCAPVTSFSFRQQHAGCRRRPDHRRGRRRLRVPPLLGRLGTAISVAVRTVPAALQCELAE